MPAATPATVQPDAALARFLAPLVELAGAQAGLVRVLTDDGARFRLAASQGLPAAVAASEQTVERHCGSCGLAARQSGLLWSDGAGECSSRSADWNAWRAGFAAMLVVPLRQRDELLGLCNLFFAGNTPLPAPVRELLRAAGELLALALQGARLERERLRSTVMDERRLLASEVHDGIAQSLVYANLRLPLLQDAVQQGDCAQAGRYVGDVEQALTSIHSNLRDIMASFRTPLTPHGLLPGLQDIAHTFGVRSGIAVALQCEAEDLGLSVEQEVQVFRIVQEALSNIFRHARAAHAWIGVRRDAARLTIRVEDDGAGLAPAGAGDGQAHFGLGIMQERAARVGGSLQVAARDGGGTVVELAVPSDALGLPGTGEAA